MPSPFPGMDPYIESSGRWGDFHGSMIVAMRGSLNERLPKGYAAEVNLYVWFHEPEAGQRSRHIEPDVFVTEGERHAKRTRTADTLVAPRRLAFPSVQRKRHKRLQIVDIESNRVVTVIELLSPSNKEAGEDRDAYLRKRNECLASSLNFVEIDLLRGGRRLPLGDPEPDVQDFYALVCRGWEFPGFDFWSFTLRDPLPEIPIPLSEDTKDVPLPLRSCADLAYDGGRYGERLPYDGALSPRVRKRDTAWVREVLAGRSA